MTDASKQIVLTLYAHKIAPVRKLADLCGICPQTIYTWKAQAITRGRMPTALLNNKYHNNNVRVRKRKKLDDAAARADPPIEIPEQAVAIPVVLAVEEVYRSTSGT